MAGNCESQIREHMAVRMRRSEMLKHEAEAVGGSIHVARATTPYYHNIQNVRFSRCTNDLNFNFLAHR